MRELKTIAESLETDLCVLEQLLKCEDIKTEQDIIDILNSEEYAATVVFAILFAINASGQNSVCVCSRIFNNSNAHEWTKGE